MSTETGAPSGTEPRGHRIVQGPRGLPLLGSLPRFGRDPLAFFEQLSNALGVSFRDTRQSLKVAGLPTGRPPAKRINTTL